MRSERGELSAWDAIKWLLRMITVVILIATFTLAAGSFLDVDYQSRVLRADSFATKLVYTDAFGDGIMDPSRFTQSTVEQRFAHEDLDGALIGRVGARLTLTVGEQTYGPLYYDQEAYEFLTGLYRDGRNFEFVSIETPIATTVGPGTYRVEVIAG